MVATYTSEYPKTNIIPKDFRKFINKKRIPITVTGYPSQ